MAQVDGIANADHAGRFVSQYSKRLLEIVSDPAVLERLTKPVQLAGGDWSDVFIDGKHAVDDPDDLDVVAAAMASAASEAGIEFDAVGGLVLGAAPFTIAVALHARARWFFIRKEPKGRGTNRWIEGARMKPGTRVMLVDDVVTRGGSIQQAYEHVTEDGGNVVFATTLVDRGDQATTFFARAGVPYKPLLTYKDLGIDRIGDAAEPSVRAG